MARTRDRPCGAWEFLLGVGAVAALHAVADRHAGRDRVCSHPLHRRRHPDHDIDTGGGGCVRAALPLASFRPAYGVHRDRPWCWLHHFQRMVECRNPPQLVLYRGNAGCSFPWDRPDAVIAMADRPKPGSCHHWLPIPSRTTTGALTGGRLHFKSALCYAGFGKNSEPSELRARTVKRSLLSRCLIFAAVDCSCQRQRPCCASSGQRSPRALPGTCRPSR